MAITAILGCLRAVNLIGKDSCGDEEDQNTYASAQWLPLTVMASSKLGSRRALSGHSRADPQARRSIKWISGGDNYVCVLRHIFL